LKRGISLIDMPRFPIDTISQMTREEKFTSVAVYVAKTVDHLKGVEDEPSYPPLRRPHHDGSPSSSLLTNLKGEDVQSGVQEANSPHSLGAECEGKEIRPSEVAGRKA